MQNQKGMILELVMDAVLSLTKWNNPLKAENEFNVTFDCKNSACLHKHVILQMHSENCANSLSLWESYFINVKPIAYMYLFIHFVS